MLENGTNLEHPNRIPAFMPHPPLTAEPATPPTPEPTRPRPRWLRRALFLVFILLLADYALYPFLPAGGQPADVGKNGLWLRYPWYFGRHSDGEIRALARRLRKDRIRYAYFHVRHITAEGKLRYQYPEAARRLTAILREEAPEVIPMAWIYAGNNGMGGLPLVRPEQPEVRAEMVSAARWLVADCGFQGVQWDYEICRNGDPAYPALLRETRAALTAMTGPPGPHPVGVCTGMWGPAPVRLWTWDEAYFQQIAREVDQVAVMAYDSALYLPRAYARFVQEQTVRVPRAVHATNPSCEVLIGVPTYGRGGASHHGWSEQLTVALRGVRDGLSDPRFQPGSLTGVALFADYTTQPEEWQTYRRLWRGE